jgi:UPF0148 protein
MLAEHCNVCGAPKFRYQGTVICPICDVQEEQEAQRPATEIQAPEPRPYTEKDRTSFEAKKRVQAHRQKPRLGLRTSEAADEEENPVEPAEEEIPELLPKREEVRRTVPSDLTTPAAPAVSPVQAALTRRAEKSVAASKISGVHGDRRVLEDLLFKKMVNIAGSLQDETDPRSIAEDLGLIEKGLGIIERLRQI